MNAKSTRLFGFAFAFALALVAGARPASADPRTPTAATPTPAGARALVVLGAPVQGNGRIAGGLERRLQTAARAATRDPQAKLFVTGGAVANTHAEGPAMKQWLVAHGVDAKRIVVEDRARFTRENASLTVPLLERAGVSHVTVVTERFHVARGVVDMKAALRAAGLRGVGVDAVAAPDKLSPAERAEVARGEGAKIDRDRELWKQAAASAARPKSAR